MQVFQIIWFILAFGANAKPSSTRELIAHRGLYQNYGREDLDAQTCTANKIFPPAHNYLENTLASIRKAFELGADIVELDIHPTTELSVVESRLVVFHDWELTCRTNASCEQGCRCNEKRECNTDEQSWNYLHSLDIGFNYTADQGGSFPFREKGIAAIPTFMEATSLLAEFPTKRLLVNVKDKYERTQLLLLKELSQMPIDIRSRVLVEFQSKFAQRFKKLSVPEAIWQSTGSKKCFLELTSATNPNFFPKACRNLKFFVPLHQDMGAVKSEWRGIELVNLIPGWPEEFLKNAKQHNSQIYLSQVNNEADVLFAQTHAFSGIMTDRIEFVAPLMKEKRPLDIFVE